MLFDNLVKAESVPCVCATVYIGSDGGLVYRSGDMDYCYDYGHLSGLFPLPVLSFESISCSKRKSP